VDVEAVIIALGAHYDPNEAAIIERVLRESNGTVQDKQPTEEAALTLAIHRRQQRG